MNNKQTIEHLKIIERRSKRLIDRMEDPDNDVFVKDVEALNIAIKALEGTAPEVPVQKQLNNEFIEKIQKNLPSYYRNIDMSQGSIFYAIIVATIDAFQQVSKEF